MNKILDFYKKIEQDQDLQRELLALNEKYKDRAAENNIAEIIQTEIIAIAKKHDYILVKEDFEALAQNEIDEKELEAVAGGMLACIVAGAGLNDMYGGCFFAGFAGGGADGDAMCFVLGLKVNH